MNADAPQLTHDQAIALLDLLCGDDAFRARFAADPAAALREIGVDYGVEPPPCGCVETLAPKEELAQARAQLLGYFSEGIHMQGAPVFESGKVQAALAAR